MNNLTAHGEKRLRKRLGLNKSSLDKAFGDALLKGRQHNEFKGKFKKYLDGKCMVYHSTPLVFGQNIYWHSNSRLITVTQVPAMYRKYL